MDPLLVLAVLLVQDSAATRCAAVHGGARRVIILSHTRCLAAAFREICLAPENSGYCAAQLKIRLRRTSAPNSSIRLKLGSASRHCQLELESLHQGKVTR